MTVRTQGYKSVACIGTAEATKGKERQGDQGTNLGPAKGVDPHMPNTRRDINLPNGNEENRFRSGYGSTSREGLQPVTSVSTASRGTTALREALLGERFLDSRKYSRSRKGETSRRLSEVVP